AWDADASTVSIRLGADRIVITDDGEGMTVDQANERFLKVGYRRRQDRPPVTPAGRHVMGRKGIGKLSLFAIADVVQVESVCGDQHHGFIMRSDDIRAQVGDGDGRYQPDALTALSNDLNRGTRITLSEIKTTVDKRTLLPLRRRLARRFSVIGPSHGFEVATQLGTEEPETISVGDRGYWRSIEFIWAIGSEADDTIEICSSNGGEPKQSKLLDGECGDSEGWSVTGWIGTVKEQRQLEEGDNVVPVLAHGKLVHEDLLSQVKQGGIFTKYVVGELRRLRGLRRPR
ncbi:MAG: ATP-binding protein, partial [Ilumatobacteraceae bacterium]